MAKRREDAPPPPDPEALRSRKDAEKAPKDGAKPEAKQGDTILGHLRGWSDALVLAFLLAMFIRMYLFELYQIPTGSMTPTLIGDEARLVTEVDWDRDGQDDIVVVGSRQAPTSFQVHLRNSEGRFEDQLFVDGGNIDMRVRQAFADPHARGSGRTDNIFVNKFAYWFRPPRRGDIVVFKVPDRPEADQPFDPAKPVYIKRAVGLPSEVLEVQPLAEYERRDPGDPGRRTPDEFGGVEWLVRSRPLLVDGEAITHPPFDRLHFFPMPHAWPGRPDPDAPSQVFHIGPDEVYLLGDNARSSKDSRYWGGVPLTHVRGRAVLRYWPWRAVTLFGDED